MTTKWTRNGVMWFLSYPVISCKTCLCPRTPLFGFIGRLTYVHVLVMYISYRVSYIISFFMNTGMEVTKRYQRIFSAWPSTDYNIGKLYFFFEWYLPASLKYKWYIFYIWFPKLYLFLHKKRYVGYPFIVHFGRVIKNSLF